MLLEAHTLFQNLFSAVLMATSSVSEQVRQSPEADSKSESAAFSLNFSWVDLLPLWSVLSLLLGPSVLPEAPMPFLGTSGGVFGDSPLPCDMLCPLLTLTSAVLAWTLLSGWSSGALLGEWSYFVCCGSMRNPMSECPTGGVLIRGMFDRGRMGKGGVSVWHTGLLMETRAFGPQTLEFGSPRGLCSSLHSGSQCLTHVTCGKSTRTGSGGDAPEK